MQRNHDKLTYQSVVINMCTTTIHYGNQMESPERDNGARYVHVQMMKITYISAVIVPVIFTRSNQELIMISYTCLHKLSQQIPLA